VENDVPEAITFLGSAYHFGGFGLVKSDKKAAKIWKRASELGDVVAMRCLGGSYAEGLGVKLDKKKAERLCRAAADRGDAVAQNKIACLLHSEEKLEEAFRYFALAADQGFTIGELNLGLCYRGGGGTEVDLGKARYWLERAAAKGDKDAIESLARLDARV
jgi:TPR repeat protein